MMNFLEVGPSSCSELEYLLAEDPKMHNQSQLEHSIFHPDPDASDWQGVFIEPNPKHLVRLLESLKTRPSDRYKVFSGGISAENCDTVEFFFSKYTTDDGLDWGFSAVERPEKLGSLFVPTYSLDKIIEITAPPDFIYLQLFSLVIPVLETYSFQPRPQQISVNCWVEDVRADVEDIFRNNGYDAWACEPKSEGFYEVVAIDKGD